MAEEMINAVIMDLGSGFCKVGLAGEKSPKIHIPNVVGKKKIEMKSIDKNVYIGEEALKMKGVLNINNPVKRGLITDWDDVEQIWDYCFNKELILDSSIHPVLHGISPVEEDISKERMLLVFFETFKVPGFYCASTPLLSLFIK